MSTSDTNKHLTKNMKSKQSYKNITTQVRIDSGLHQLLKIKAAKSSTTIRALVEGCLAELLEVKSET